MFARIIVTAKRTSPGLRNFSCPQRLYLPTKMLRSFWATHQNPERTRDSIRCKTQEGTAVLRNLCGTISDLRIMYMAVLSLIVTMNQYPTTKEVKIEKYLQEMSVPSKSNNKKCLPQGSSR